jgi:hypothetical protein
MRVRGTHVRARRLALSTCVACSLAVVASAAYGAATAGRRPPTGGVEFQGVFHRALWGGNVSFQISADGKGIARVQGTLPATCHDRRDGRTKRAGPDGAVALLFDVGGAAIRPNGTFSYTAHNAGGEGLDRATFTISGTFYGSNMLGQISGRSTSSPANARYTKCAAREPFWARRVS